MDEVVWDTFAYKTIQTKTNVNTDPLPIIEYTVSVKLSIKIFGLVSSVYYGWHTWALNVCLE